MSTAIVAFNLVAEGMALEVEGHPCTPAQARMVTRVWQALGEVNRAAFAKLAVPDMIQAAELALLRARAKKLARRIK